MKEPKRKFGRRSKKPNPIGSIPTQTPVGCFERGRIEVDEVVVQPQHEAIDDDVVHQIQESFAFTGGGCFQPIGVRRRVESVDGEDVTRCVLVFGAKRLEAQKAAGLKYIDCVYLEGDELEIKLVALSENFMRTKQSVLDRAELLTEWVRLAVRKTNLSGQVDQKLRLGRPSGGLAKAARVLPIFGRTPDARRQAISRAVKIAGIAINAKTIAREAGLDDNQNALLRIAKVTGPMAQAKRAADLAGKLGQLIPGENGKGPDPDDFEGKNLDPGAPEQKSKRTAVPAVIAPGPKKVSPPDGDDDDQKKRDQKSKRIEPTTVETLLELWKFNLKKPWQYAPVPVRVEFIKSIRNTKCLAAPDVVEFVYSIFQGRKKIACEDIYCVGLMRGLNRKAIRETLRDLSYPRKRERPENGPWYYYNKDRHWKDGFPVIRDNEISRAVASVREHREEDGHEDLR